VPEWEDVLAATHVAFDVKLPDIGRFAGRVERRRLGALDLGRQHGRLGTGHLRSRSGFDVRSRRCRPRAVQDVDVLDRALRRVPVWGRVVTDARRVVGTRTGWLRTTATAAHERDGQPHDHEEHEDGDDDDEGDGVHEGQVSQKDAAAPGGAQAVSGTVSGTLAPRGSVAQVDRLRDWLG
jgi:hypothetical protein